MKNRIVREGAEVRCASRNNDRADVKKVPGLDVVRCLPGTTVYRN